MLIGRRPFIMGFTAAFFAPVAFGRSSAPAQSTRFEWAMISVGNNMPAIDVDDKYNAILAELHLRQPASEIARRLKLAPAELRIRLDALVREGLARADGRGGYLPTALVITLDDAARHLRADPAVVSETVDIITRALPDVRRRYARLPGFRHVSFGRASLLVLSDALLDNWQINRVEDEFLRVPRPQRAGGRYYYAVFERRAGDPVESLGIYGNHTEDLGGVSLNLYGNQRYDGLPNLITLSADDFSRRFGFPAGIKAKDARRELVRDLERQWREPNRALSPVRVGGLHELGLVDARGRVIVPVLSAKDESGLSGMAAAFAPALIATLERHRSVLDAQYRASPYAAKWAFLR